MDEGKKIQDVGKENGTKVCVTGASGYIASWLVKLLLQRGYIVHATVRDPYDPKRTEHLVRLEGAKERLHLFKADLMVEGSFDSAFDGCKGVFHTASPVIFKSDDPQVDILDPAVKGTSNVLKSCKKFASIRRVIVTSSMCTMLHNFRKLAPDVVVDESWYADIEYCNINGSDLMWYIRSKIIAEQSAWEFAKENKMDLVIMNPGMVIGPMLQPTLNESVAVVLNLINGSSDTYPNSACPWVDVKDVAEAHIYAFEIPSAEGRYILAESVLHYSDVLKILHELYPTIKLPNKPVDFNRKTSYQVSQSKAKSLGIEYIPFKESLKNTVENLKEMKFV